MRETCLRQGRLPARARGRGWLEGALVVGIALSAPAVAGGELALPDPGPWGSGFRVERIVDTSRSGAEVPGGRPLQLTLWYPATPGGEALRFGDYARALRRASSSLEPWNAVLEESALREAINNTAPWDLPADAVAALAASPVRARRGAPTAPGRFPLALWAVRYGTPLAQSLLSEWLASRGYVVVAVEPAELRPPPVWERSEPARLQTVFEDWARDLEVAWGHANGLSFVRPGAAAVLAWSYGGTSAVLVARRRNDVAALVSLDATNFWTVDRLAESAYGDASDVRAPTLVLHEGGRADARTIAEAITRAPVWKLRFDAIRHGNFNATEGYLPSRLELSPLPPWSVDGEAGILGYEAVSRVVAGFLEAHHPVDPESASFFDAAALVSSEHVEVELHRGGIEEAEDPAGALAGRLARLVEDLRFSEARAEIDAALERDGASARLRRAASESLLRMGDVRAALEQARRAVDLAPGDGELAEWLARLETLSDPARR